MTPSYVCTRSFQGRKEVHFPSSPRNVISVSTQSSTSHSSSMLQQLTKNTILIAFLLRDLRMFNRETFSSYKSHLTELLPVINHDEMVPTRELCIAWIFYRSPVPVCEEETGSLWPISADRTAHSHSAFETPQLFDQYFYSSMIFGRKERDSS